MITYKKAQFKKLLGTYEGTVRVVEVVPNNFYKEEYQNSTPKNLEITFELQDEVAGGPVMHTERFVSPLTGGKFLYQQLLDAIGEIPDLETGDFDEQRFVGLDVVVQIGENKKGYSVIESLVKTSKKAAPAKPSKKEDVVEDLPDFLK